MNDSSMKQHACKILTIIASRDQRIEDEYVRSISGVPTSESSIVDFGQSVNSDNFSYKKRRLYKIIKNQDGNDVKIYDNCLDRGFLTAEGVQTRNSGVSKIPELTYINGEKEVKRRKRDAEAALKSSLNLNQIFWVHLRFKYYNVSIVDLAKQHNVCREVIDKPVRRAVDAVMPVLSS